MNIQEAINKLVAYGLKTGLIEKEDIIYTVNSLLILLGLDSADYEEADIEKLAQGIDTAAIDSGAYLEAVLKELDDYAVSQGLIENSPYFTEFPQSCGCQSLRRILGRNERGGKGQRAWNRPRTRGYCSPESRSV